MKQIKQDEDPPQSTFGKAISFLLQAFPYPIRLLSSWLEKLPGYVVWWTMKMASPTTPESKTLHGSLHGQRLLHRRLLDKCTGLLFFMSFSNE